MSIGENIRSRRKELDMTLEEVASLVGLSRQTLSRYETGIIGNIPSDRIELLAKALHTSPAYLMGWEDDATTSIPHEKKPTVKDDGLSDVERLFLSLSPERREEVLRFMEYLAQSEK